LFHGQGSDWELSKPVESSSGGNPYIAFTILKKTEDDIAREAIRSRKYICPAVMDMDEPALYCSDPETSIAVPEESIRIEIAVRERSIRIACASNGIRFEVVTDELHEPCGVDGN
jgi:hypothetical protein